MQKDTTKAPFLQFPSLFTDRLHLRHLRLEDAQSIFEYKSRNDTQEFPRIERHTTISESQTFLADTVIKKYNNKKGIYWAITVCPDDSVIGTVALCAMHGDDLMKHRAEISFVLSSEYQRKGIMTEACRAIINYAFLNWRSLQRIHAEIASTNEPSLNMSRKIGFKEEGVLRRYQHDNKGKLWDIHILSLLKDDWNSTSFYRVGTAHQSPTLIN